MSSESQFVFGMALLMPSVIFALYYLVQFFVVLFVEDWEDRE